MNDRVLDPLRRGHYFAIVEREEQGTAGTIYLCKRDKERVTFVPQ